MYEKKFCLKYFIFLIKAIEYMKCTRQLINSSILLGIGWDINVVKERKVITSSGTGQGRKIIMLGLLGLTWDKLQSCYMQLTGRII